ncbi:hypothetical protein ACTFIW_011209 [Dictyostelium discoideum]
MKMKKSFQLYFIILFLSILNQRFGNSTQINGLIETEYDCIHSLYETFNLMSIVVSNGNFSFFFCNSTSIKCDGGFIISLNFKSPSLSLPLSSNHISCFNNLNKIKIDNSSVDPDITSFKGKNNTEITLFNVDNINNLILPSVSSKISLIIEYYSCGFNFKITSLSNFSSVKIDCENLEILNNYNLNPNSVFGNLTLVNILKIPDLTNVSIPSITYELNSPDLNSFSNFSTHNKIKKIVVSGKSAKDFFFPFFPSDSLEQLEFSLYQLTANSIVNISHLNKLNYLNIGDNPFFNFNNTIPFKPYPILSNTSNSIIQFLNLPDFSQIYYESIYFPDNGIESPLPLWSTLDKSYCNLRYLIMYGTQIDKTSLPSCFTCYFKDINFKNNIIGSSVPDVPIILNTCKTLIPNIIFESNKLFLVGSDLGFEWESIQTNDIEFYTRDSEYNIVNEKYLIYEIDYSFDYSKKILEFNFTKSLVNNVFYLSTWYQLPNPNPISILVTSKDQIEIKGQYFTYNSSQVLIYINNYKIDIIDTSFHSIIGWFATSNSGGGGGSGGSGGGSGGGPYHIDMIIDDRVVIFDVDELSIDKITDIPQCANECNYPEGECDYNTGICKCNNPNSNYDCSEITPTDCPIDCGLNGYCFIDSCICSDNYYGVQCEYANISISAIDETTENGGNTTLYGFFGYSSSKLQVYIGGKLCSLHSTSFEMINCLTQPGKGIVSVSIIIDGTTYNFTNIYKYLPISNNNNNNNNNNYNCINRCTSLNNGDCINSICICKNGFQGYDCSSILPPSKSNNTISDNGDTTISNQDTNYQINILSLLEIDQNNQIIKNHLLKGNWNLTKRSTQGNPTLIFTQTILSDNNNNNNKDCLITATLEEVKIKRDSNFAGINFTLDENSIKISISIKNYHYQSSLNSLQLTFESSVSDNINNGDDDDEIQYDNNCKIIDKNKIDIDNQEDQYSNYIKIQKNGKQLIGRIISRALSDGRSTFLNTLVLNKTNDSIITALQLPHCTKECLIDPDFQVLVKFNPTNCGNQEEYSSKTAIIAGSVVGGVVFLSVIGAVSFLLYKRNLEKQLSKRLAKMKRFEK